MKNKRLLMIIMALILITLSACGKKETTEEPKEDGKVVESTTASKDDDKDEDAPEVQVVPDFELTLLDGTTANLYDYKDKLIFLNFWATWCGPCKYEMPDIQKLSEEFGDKVQFIAINAGEDKDTVQSFMDENKFNFTVALDENNSTPFMVQGLPTTVILNSDYEIVESVVGLPRGSEPFDFYSEAFNHFLEDNKE